MNTIKLVTNFSSITSKFTQFGRRRVESASCTVEPLFADFSWKNTVWLIKFTCRKNLSSIYTKLIYIRLLVKLATELFFGEYVLLTDVQSVAHSCDIMVSLKSAGMLMI